MPNASGGKGVPKYVKQLEGSVETGNGTYFNGDWCEAEGNSVTDNESNLGDKIILINNDNTTNTNTNTNENDTTNNTDSNTNNSNNFNYIKNDTGILSASAMEFKPKSSNIIIPLNNGKVSYAAAAAKISSS